MQWLNEPAGWQRTNDVLRVTVDPGTDFWRATGYGYVHDNGHVYGEVLPGDLDVSVRLRGTFAHQYDQAGLMLRADERTWLKTGVEYFEGRPRLSTVLTLGWSSWMVADLPAALDEITLRMSRRGEAVEIRYAAGDGPAELAALVFMPPDREMLAGIMCAAPEGSGFIVSFYDLRVAGRDWGGPAAGQPQADTAPAWDGQPEGDTAIDWNGHPGADAAPAWGGQPGSDPGHSWGEMSGGGSGDWREPRPRTAAGWFDGPAEGMPAEGMPAEGMPAEGMPAEGMPAEWADERPAGVPAERAGERPDWAGDQLAGPPSQDGSPGHGQATGWTDERSGGAVLDWAQPLASDAVSDWDRLSGSLAAARGAGPADEQPQTGGKKRRGGEPGSKRRSGGEPGGGEPGGSGLSSGGLSGSGLSGSEPASKRRRGGEPGGGEPGSAEAGSERRGGAPGSKESGGREPGSKEPGGGGPGSKEPGGREPGSKEPGGGGPGSKEPGGGGPAAGQARSLPDDRTDPVLPAATEDRPAPATRKRGTPKLPGARLSGAAGSSEPADAADEWISLLTAEDPVEE
jgi:regulation of enolase protein 1 (concanavalin A-like superfamily)